MNYYICPACGASMHTLYPLGATATCPNCGGTLERASKTTDHKIASHRSKSADDRAARINFTARNEG